MSRPKGPAGQALMGRENETSGQALMGRPDAASGGGRTPLIKVCGMRRPEDIAYVNEFVPDFVGFIFDPTRRRFIEPTEAAALRQALDPRIRSVGVFVNADPDWLLDTAELVKFDIIQLHGQEDEGWIEQLREKTDRPIVKAFKVTCQEDVDRAVRSPADVILLDNGAGGTGETIDWSLVQNVERDFFLAGGLGPDNAADAVMQVRPYGLDASSGLETDGWKDRDKIRRFVEAVRSR